MTYALKIAVSDPDAPLTLKAVSELSDLLDDEDDRRVSRELLFAAKMAVDKLGWKATIGDIVQMVEESDEHELKALLDGARRRAGLKSVEKQRAEEARLAREAGYSHRSSRIGPHEPRWAIMEGGAVVDLAEREIEDQRERLEAEALATRREHERQEREIRGEQLRQVEAAKAEKLEREDGLRQRYRAS